MAGKKALEIFNIDEASKYTGLNNTTLLMLIDSGEINNFSKGEKPVFSRLELDLVMDDFYIIEFYKTIPREIKIAEEDALFHRT